MFLAVYNSEIIENIHKRSSFYLLESKILKKWFINAVDEAQASLLHYIGVSS